MSKIDVLKKGVGAVVDKHGETQITVWAPHAHEVFLYLCKDGKNLPLTKSGYGTWTLTEKLNTGEQYYFILDGDKKLPDPASVHQPEGVHGPSQIVDLSFDWTDSQWKNMPLENYIFYELHTGTFTTEGTFCAIESKLDYLKELGITAIEIMPVAQFPGDRNWGYDGVFPFAVQNSYGGVEALQHLVNECHKKGLAVVLDVVYNHLGPEGNYLAEYGPYFTDKYRTPWGRAINYDDSWCDGVRSYYIENALMWLRDFHIDALRLDAVHAIKDLSPKHILSEIKEYVDELMKATGRIHYLVVECDLNDTKYINPLPTGYGMDAQWTDEFHHALRVVSGNERNGYYADFNGIEHLAKAYKDAYVYDGIYSLHRQKTFGSKADKNPGKQFVVFSQNHDQVGNRMLGERTSTLVSFEMRKLVAAAVMISPYLPLLFMGEEWSAVDPFLYFISHTDADLVAAVRKGRKEEFASFHGDGEVPDPQAEDSFNKSKLNWDLLKKREHVLMLQYYKALIALRKQHPALKNLVRENMDVHANAGRQVLVLKRWFEDQKVLCYLNFSKEIQVVLRQEQGMKKLFESCAIKWGGSAPANEDNANMKEIELQPESIMIYAN